MTGRDLIIFILKHRMVNATIVTEDTVTLGQAWHHVERKHLIRGNGILIIKHPEVKRKKENMKEKVRTCKWTKAHTINNTWNTECGDYFIIDNGLTPKEKQINFCPICGKKVK